VAEVGGVLLPEMPSSLKATGIDPEVLLNLALKLAYISPHFDTESAAQQLRLPLSLTADLLEQLRVQKLLEVLGGSGAFTYRFRITQAGRERGEWLMAISGYVGPAPVSLQAYRSMLQLQLLRLPDAAPQDVATALADLVLPEQTVELAGLAVSSGRCLFLYGPPGNGKTSLGRQLHQALQGSLWIPHCLGIENQIIRVFDRQCHVEAVEDLPQEAARRYDERWVRIRRPFVLVGGELTLQDLDLIYDSARRYYEAPLHFKANGGSFLLDDFGCQRTPPNELLNRWIVPLEQQVDYLTLRTGQQIQVPFRNMLVISTNRDPHEVMAPGLLRRMGYRVQLADPSPEHFALIFTRYAARHGLESPPELLEWLLARYRTEQRPLRSCQPRDLVERVRDICKFRGWRVELTRELMTLAWKGYFGSEAPDGL
jgi:predicted ATPase with chaperone activity